MDRLLGFVFAGSRGGATRARIIHALLAEPRNTRQLAQALGMDYKTIQYNLRVLEKHRYAVTDEEGYGKRWRASKNLVAVQAAFEALTEGLPR